MPRRIAWHRACSRPSSERTCNVSLLGVPLLEGLAKSGKPGVAGVWLADFCWFLPCSLQEGPIEEGASIGQFVKALERELMTQITLETFNALPDRMAQNVLETFKAVEITLEMSDATLTNTEVTDESVTAFAQ